MPIDPKTLPLNVLKCMQSEQRRPLGKAGMLPEEAERSRQIKGERTLQSTLIGYLRTRGIVPMSPTFGKKSRITPGWPDITFSYYGRACAWEVKFGAGDTSDEQKKVLAEMAAAPNCWQVAVIRSVEAAKIFLDEIQEKALTGVW